MKKIYWFEPLFFLFFGIFHLHRIWGILDRKAYAEFWLGIMESRGVFYYAIMIILAGLCMLGIAVFSKKDVIITGGDGYICAAVLISFSTFLL